MDSSPKVKKTTKPRHGKGGKNLPRSQKEAHGRLPNQHQNDKSRSSKQQAQAGENAGTSDSRSVNDVTRRKKANSESSYSSDGLPSQQSGQTSNTSTCLQVGETGHQAAHTEDQGENPGALEKNATTELHKVAESKKLPSKRRKKRSKKDMKANLVGSEESDALQLSAPEEQAKKKSKKKKSKGNSDKKAKGACGPEFDAVAAGNTPNKNTSQTPGI